MWTAGDRNIPYFWARTEETFQRTFCNCQHQKDGKWTVQWWKQAAESRMGFHSYLKHSKYILVSLLPQYCFREILPPFVPTTLGVLWYKPWNSPCQLQACIVSAACASRLWQHFLSTHIRQGLNQHTGCPTGWHAEQHYQGSTAICTPGFCGLFLPGSPIVYLNLSN